MWIQLGNEYLNLDHVIRMRFTKGWKNGQEEIVAEVEGLIKGDVQVFTRYRGREAEILLSIMEMKIQPMEDKVSACRVPVPAGAMVAEVPSSSSTNTLADVKI